MAAALEYLGEMDAAIARGSWNIAEAADVRAVSSRLAEKRAPAFYFEYDEDADVARSAAEDARRIHRLCTRLAAAIEERQRSSESLASDAE